MSWSYALQRSDPTALAGTETFGAVRSLEELDATPSSNDN
jgi:hypothetical protein